MSIPIKTLAEPFPQEQVKQRRGNFGQQLAYIEAATVIHRLNETMEGDWSFTVVETQIEMNEVIVRGRLSINGTIREQFGGSRITRHKDSSDMISLADDLKAATSDALKKCATLAGVGLHLYSDVRSNGNGHNSTHKPQSQHTNGQRPQNGTSNRLSNAEIANIFRIAHDTGVAQKDVIAWARESFDATISQLTSEQGDTLIAMITAQAA